MDEISAQIMSAEEGKEKYDAVLKQLLSNREFLARIVKAYVAELSMYSLEEIMKKYIAPEPPMVSKMNVQFNLTNLVESQGTESNSNTEANTKFDIMFKVMYPGKDGKYIGMFINLEIQNHYHVGYPIEMRGIYYAARRLSSQLTKIDRDTDYGQLLKVYSIWICMGDDVPKKDAGTVSLYQMKKDDIIGAAEVKQEMYDLLSVVIVRIRDDSVLTDNTLEILQTVCSMLIGKEQKIQKLKELGVHVDKKMESEVDKMDALNYGIFLKKEEQGEKRGEKKGEKKGKILTLSTLLKQGVITLPVALQNSGLSEEEFFQAVQEYTEK